MGVFEFNEHLFNYLMGASVFCVDGLKILELEEPIKQMKIIHVAGTKGKVRLIHLGIFFCFGY